MRVGRIPYINCYPVYGAIDRGIVPLDGRARRRRADRAESRRWPPARSTSASISAVEYARDAERYLLLPDLAISCDGPVRSVVLFSKRPAAELQRPARAREPQLDDERRAARAAVRERVGRAARVRSGRRRARRHRAVRRRGRTTRGSSSATRRCTLVATAVAELRDDADRRLSATPTTSAPSGSSGPGCRSCSRSGSRSARRRSRTRWPCTPA